MTKTIALRNCRGEVVAQALVDDCDFDRLNQYRWHLSEKGYATRTEEKNGRRTIRMHREVAQTPKGLQTDHINGNRLDDRRENLRICTHTENLRNAKRRDTNASGYKGVCWHKATGRWQALIRVGGTRKHLGLFDSPEDAHAAYCAAADQFHGEFANHG